MALATIVKNYVPDAFLKITDPVALQKYLLRQLGKISNSIALLNQVAQPAPVTFANAPASPVLGQRQPFSDSNTVVWGATIAGGGTNFVTGHWNGTHWTVQAV